jgi:hypothetical protein
VAGEKLNEVGHGVSFEQWFEQEPDSHTTYR